MNTSNSAAENSIASEADTDHQITGLHFESPRIANATTYWRCTDWGRESIRERDLHRETFHAADCEVADRC